MFNPQKALIPGIIIGSMALILIARFLTSVEPASAATPEPQAVTDSISTHDCFLASLPNPILPWCGLIEQASENYGVPAVLIASVMLQESGGQAEVI